MADLPVTHNLRAYRGDTWAQTFRLIWEGQPVDLSTSTVTAWAVNCTDRWALVTTGDQDGYVTVALPDPPLNPATYQYDIEVTDPNAVVTTWIRGRLTVTADITNDLEYTAGSPPIMVQGPPGPPGPQGPPGVISPGSVQPAHLAGSPALTAYEFAVWDGTQFVRSSQGTVNASFGLCVPVLAGPPATITDTLVPATARTDGSLAVMNYGSGRNIAAR